MIERIVATWLDLYFAEMVCNQWKGGSIHEGKYKQHRIDQSHRQTAFILVEDVGDGPKNGDTAAAGHHG